MQGHFKTGHEGMTGTAVVIPYRKRFGKSSFTLNDTSADDMATQGCDRSADRGASIVRGGIAAPAWKCLPQSDKSQGMGTESPFKKRSCSLFMAHDHSAAVAV